MMQFTKPNPFNGETFISELKTNNIIFERFYDDGIGNLVIFADDKDKTKIENILKTHDGTDSVRVDYRAAAVSKLIDLGLTEEEIAAL